MIILEQEDPDLYARVQEANLVRQYALLTNCIEIGIGEPPTVFDKFMLWSLNHVAVANISQLGGRFREEPIYVNNHIPPHFKDVPDLMDRFFAFIHENWYTNSLVRLASYTLWRLNWIHPFVEGNGRTARAACYYVMCVKAGRLHPGNKIVPERIRENREEYLAALHAADRAWEGGNLDLSRMIEFLGRLLREQLAETTPAPAPSPAP
jgi:Fic family protein